MINNTSLFIDRISARASLPWLPFTLLLLLTLPSLEAGKEIPLNLDTRSIDRELGEHTPHSYAKMLKTARQSVVSVYSAKVVQVVQSRGHSSPQHDLFRRFFGIPLPHQGQPEYELEERKVPQGVGSGVIISEDGYVLTNNHVVTSEQGEDADEIYVKLQDGSEHTAEIIGRDPQTDVALLKIDKKDLPAIAIADSDKIEIGDVVFAIGNPMGVGQTVTQGIISATRRQIGIYGKQGYEDFIQTDASINPGNSGGALVDSLGRLIGINSAILSRTGGNIGIGFAIPSNLARSVSTQILKFGEPRRGYIGVQISNVDPDMAEAFGIEGKKGVLINKVETDLPADNAGIERGDIIVSIDGKTVDTANTFRIRIGQTAPGETVDVILYRDGRKKTIELTVGDQSELGKLYGDTVFEGVEVMPVGPEERHTYGIPEEVSGIVIVHVESTSPYSRSFSQGMVIMEINDETASDPIKAKELLRNGVNKLYIYSQGYTRYVALRLMK